jgi:GT2 family glycosyltransferase
MRHIELIISANGCTDNTREYLNDLSSQFKSLGFEENLKIVWHDQPLGYSKATNVGIQAATTEYLLLLNNDTILLAQSKDLWLDMLVNPFTKNSFCASGSAFPGINFGFL